MELHLTSEQRQLLQEILQERHRELLHEISHTDHYHYKEVLKTRVKALESLLDVLAGEPVTQ